MALAQRQPGADVELVHHSDAGSQYLSFDDTQELADHGVLASVGSVGDAFDNALAESFVDSFKARRAPPAPAIEGRAIRSTPAPSGGRRAHSCLMAVASGGSAGLAARQSER